MQFDKQQGLAQQARELHAGWVKMWRTGNLACPDRQDCLSSTMAEEVKKLTDARAGELADKLARGAITTEEHNDQRFVMVMAMRRLIDGGCDDHAARIISRQMHDLYADNPPLPNPKYRFSYDWVTTHTDDWKRDLQHLRGQPNVRALEIGCFEGQSACWFLDNILTHPTSRLVCVDPFAVSMASILLRYFEARFDENIAASGAADRVTKLIGPSQVVVRMLQPVQFDFIYVDGSHKVGDVLVDAVLAWTVLRPGGVVMFDDYALVDDAAPEGLMARAPGRALDAFMSILGQSAELVRRDWQLVLRKM
ncbi:MAG TPA: class I SAM-dependent methyltransferase [Vicinamibacterales bacterium]